MFSIIGCPLFRLERYPLPDGVIYSFYADPEFSSQVVMKEAFCSIIMTGILYDKEVDDYLLQIQRSSRDLRLNAFSEAQKNQEYLANPSMIHKTERIRGYRLSPYSVSGNIDDIDWYPYGDFPTPEYKENYCKKTIDKVIKDLWDAGSENPSNILGPTIYFLEKYKNDDDKMFYTTILAIPIFGLVTPIRRNEAYTLYNGKLAILEKDTTISVSHIYQQDDESEQNIHQALKTLYLTGDIYGSLRFSEYLVTPKTHIMHHIEYEVALSDYAGSLSGKGYFEQSFSLGPVNRQDINPKIKNLFTINKNASLFQLGNLPKGVRRKNNELVTKL